MHIYCSGIGGIGLSAYASLQRIRGHAVFGSDRTESALLGDLRSQGVEISLDQGGACVPSNIDLFVYSEAIPPDAPERKRALALGVRQCSYPQALGELSRPFHVIAVCGTHGKSSTTAMAAKMLMECGMDPTVIVGTKVRELGGRNWRAGKSNLFLLEACEYRRSFLHYSPREILLTNADGDHFDYYSSKEDYQRAFQEFLSLLPPAPDGTVITHMGDPDCAIVAASSLARTVDADQYSLLPLATPGLHMRQNAQLVLGLAEVLGIPLAEAKSSLSSYAGCWRRMELRGETIRGIPVIDDYAHHPREIRATLEAIRGAYPGKRLVSVFQPHTHDRILKLSEEFTRAFRDADLVLVTDVYDARPETEKAKVDVAALTAGIHDASGIDVISSHSLQETGRILHEVLREGDVLLCMGAGDITGLAERMVSTSGFSL